MKNKSNIFSLISLTAIVLCAAIDFAFAQDADISDIDDSDSQSNLSENVSENFIKNDLFTKNTVEKKNSIASLSFVWNKPVNMAAFERNEKIWIVFDRPTRVDIEQFKETAKDLVEEIYTLPHPGGTFVVIKPAPNVKYTLRQEGLLWIVDLFSGRAPKFKHRNMTMFTQYDSLRNSYIFIPNDKTGNIVSVIDPEIGDIMSVATTSELGLGFDSPYRYPDFDILPAAQGLAFVINTPDILLNRGNSGITLKALGRSLNITEDLDLLKRRQKQNKANSEEEIETTAFDLQISKDLHAKNLIEVVDSFKKQILAAPADQKNLLRIKLAQYYIYYGLGTNALHILNQIKNLDIPEAKTDKFYALTGIANFLARRYQEATDNFSKGNLPKSQEGVFWRTIAQSALNHKEENNAVIFAQMSLMRDYPQSIKDAISIIAATNAIATNDDLSSQNFIDILKSVPDRTRDLNPQINYLLAQKLEMQGYIRNAIKEYQKLINSDSTMFSAYARLHYTILSQMLNFMDAPTAVKELEKLRFAWGEKEFKIKLLGKLSDFYLKDKDYYNALRTLNEQGFLSAPEQKERIAKKMVKIFEDIFISNHADEVLSPIKALALYNDFKWLSSLSPNQNLIMQKLADRLVAVDLLPRAQELLLSLMQKKDLSPDAKARVGSRLAVIYLFENKPKDALMALEATESPNLMPETINPRRIAYARALSQIGRFKEALALLENETSPVALRYKFEIYWAAKDWNKASNVVKFLIQEPNPDQKLSEEQIGYILDWATTLKQAGKETVLLRLRNKFMPYFKGTNYESAFNILTSNLEKEKIDINAIHSMINDVQNFNHFTKIYSESLAQDNDEK